jgi:hypothetical protein
VAPQVKDSEVIDLTKDRNPSSKYFSHFIDMLVVVVCLAGMFFSVRLFWEDFNRTLDSHADPVGNITYKHRAAQGRFANRVLWFRLKQGASIYSGDLIRTAELSDTRLTFNFGEKIDLSENSLIRVNIVNNEIQIELSEGNIIAATPGGRALTLVSGKNKVMLAAGTTLNARVIPGDEDSSEGLNIQVTEGIATVTASDGTVQEALAGEAFSISAEGEKMMVPQVVALTPKPDDQRLSAEGAPVAVNFSWSTSNFSGSDKVAFEIAEDRRFAKILQRTETEKTSAELTMPVGIYWWRVYAASEDTGSRDNAPAQKFTVYVEEKPVLAVIPSLVPIIAPPPLPPPPPEIKLSAPAERTPENGFVIGPEQLRQDRSLTFSWQPVAGANGYIFTILAVTGGSRRVVITNGPDPATSYFLADIPRGIGRGSFIWQVEAVNLKTPRTYEKRGNLGANSFIVNIPQPGDPKPRDPGLLYGRPENEE